MPLTLEHVIGFNWDDDEYKMEMPMGRAARRKQIDFRRVKIIRALLARLLSSDASKLNFRWEMRNH